MKQTGEPEGRPENADLQNTDRGAPDADTSAQQEPVQGVAPEIARQIDENLKRLYQHHVSQDLSPELQALVARLKSGNTPVVPDKKDEA